MTNMPPTGPPIQPTQQPHYAPPTAPVTPKSLALTALIVGIVAFLIGWVPVLGFIVGAAAVAFGIIALAKKQPKGLSITGLILGALAVITSIAMTIGVAAFTEAITEPTETAEVTPAPEPEPKPEVEPETEPEPEAEPEEPVGASDAERSAALEQAIKNAFGVESFTELYVEDPTMWGGYINGVRVESTRAHITLQVDRSSPDGRDMGERAAQALSTLLSKDDVEGIDWIIVEDGAGTVIDQKRPAPIM